MANRFIDIRGTIIKHFNFCAVFWWTLVLGTIASLGYLLSAVPRFQNVETQDTSPPSWLEIQEHISFNGILDNFGSAGAKAYSAADGILLDSSWPKPQDHLWTRTRDSHLVFKTLVDRFVRTGDQSLQIAINRFISAQAILQQVTSPSGSLEDGSGLSEPRFLPNMTPDPSNYGRPKRDGPALRAITLMAYGRWLLSHNYLEAARDIVWPIVLNDLNYVGEYWHESTIDFWSSPRNNFRVDSFFIRAAQHHALVEGAVFSRFFGFNCTMCESQAPQILCTMQEFRKAGEKQGFIVSDLINGTAVDRSGLDTSTLFASIFNFDPLAGCNDETFQPCSELMLRNHKVMVDQFRSWVINAGVAPGKAVAFGSYPEETTDKNHGNPWYVSTLAAAEQMYDSLWVYDRFGSITIGDLSLPFWKDIYPAAKTGLWLKGSISQGSSGTYKELYNAMKSYADGFIEIVRNSLPENGSLYEQFSYIDGKPLGARDLSWSYGAFLSMKDRREGKMPVSWGARNAARIIPFKCNITQFKGTYNPVEEKSWPKFPCKPRSTVQITFNLFGQNTTEGSAVYLYGSVSQLGSWDQKKAMLMTASRTRTDKEVPLWIVSIEVPVGTRLEYRYRINEQETESTSFQYQVKKETCWYAAATQDTW